MVVVVLALLGALVAGRLAGGRLANLGDVPLRRAWLVVAAVAAQLAGALLPVRAAYPVGLTASAMLAGGFLALNRRTAGLGLVALGFAANALAVAANGGVMPVSLHALARVDGSLPALLADSRHAVAVPATRLRLLTDVVPAPLPFGLGQVLSPGDVAVASGCALLVFQGMRRRARRARQRVGPSEHGQEGAQAPRTQEERRQPREAPERLSDVPRPHPESPAP